MFFSVIVPIYKVEKYLHRCIDSILRQTFSDFELILVDDGSPDDCPAICDAYAEKDNRIKVIHKENGGLVSARQVGTKAASGEYVFHVDSDDAVLEHALQTAYDIIQSTGADMVTFSYRIYRDGKVSEPIYDLAEEGLYDKGTMQTEIYPKLLVDENMQHMFYFWWGKAIKRTLALPIQLSVRENISLGEDLSCTVPCYLKAENVYVSHEPLYLYTIRDDSISTSFRTNQLTQIADVISGLRCTDAEKPEDFEAQIARYSCFMCFAILAAAAEDAHFDSLKELENLIKGSLHMEEIPKAEFRHISKKSRIAISWMKKGYIKSAFYFLYLCGKIKKIRKRSE